MPTAAVVARVPLGTSTSTQAHLASLSFCKLVSHSFMVLSQVQWGQIIITLHQNVTAVLGLKCRFRLLEPVCDEAKTGDQGDGGKSR